ncbi:hypothetical protein Hmuk_0065 [Halomicrobium mukohataei DSM 12286]|uniref:Uncharacterized protein n=1 Tax=Halomicrobium mukohataei (strain ATCC 700874 / DSM 12286 / JCM 9738 / NCIMB 13541) TaxID=485914 RepID=C7NVU9_HALMD|nr:hypothetical protein Hmuk_0065 [Halomicrobium mukohataei DSM 12286]
MVPRSIVKPTAQFVTGKGSQIAASIDEKICLGENVSLGELIRNTVPESAHGS